VHSRKSVRSVELEDAPSLAVRARVASSARSRVSCVVGGRLRVRECGSEKAATDLRTFVLRRVTSHLGVTFWRTCQEVDPPPLARVQKVETSY
jgi:hypothetical protein